MEKQIDVPVYQVITARSADRQYTYTGPAGLERGTLVTVPFGRRTVRGVIVASGGPVRPDMKTLEPVDGTLPPIPAELMDSLEELADYYMVPLGTMLQTALPPALMKDLPVSYRATGKRLPLVLTEDELIVMAMLRESPCRLTNMVQKLGRSATGLLKGLEKMGLVERSIDLSDELVDSVKRRAVVPVGEPDERQLAELKKRAPRQAEVLRSILSERSAPFHLMSELAARFKCGYGLFRSLEQKGLVRTFYDFKSLVNGDRHFREYLQLTAEQESFTEQYNREPGRIHVLLGITGSGKSECYLRCADTVIAGGGRVLYLVPEIGLTPAAISRLRVRFGSDVAIIHSGLSASQRLSEWLRILQGRVSIVVGTRSAAFAPVPDLKLIVVDEEHDDSYKQGTHPRYNAVHTLLFRARKAGAGVILGSASPTVESYHHAREGRYVFTRLRERVGGGKLPNVQIVDMKAEFEAAKGQKPLLSRILKDSIGKTLEAGRQVLLFLNRRGYAPFLLCRKCGHVEQCPHCSVTLTVHTGHQTAPLRCHYCDYGKDLPHVCPRCSDAFIQMMGFGTQRVEQRLGKLYPEAVIFRADRDTMTSRDSFRQLNDRMLAGEVDILIGTQMIAKGHHFPGVDLVGILDADSGLQFPDFRSRERTFSLMMQVSGRAGREAGEGSVLVQTYQADNPVFESLLAHDYEGFMQRELIYRKRTAYPPFGHMIAVEVRGKVESAVHDCAVALAARLSTVAGEPVQVLGPVASGIYRLKGWFRQAVLIRGPERGPVRRTVKKTLGSFNPGTDDVRLTIDVDPRQF